MSSVSDHQAGESAPTPWRVGRSVGRTIYDANDVLIGVMDAPTLAAQVVAAVNAEAQPPPGLWKDGQWFEPHEWEPNPRSSDAKRPCGICGVYEDFHFDTYAPRSRHSGSTARSGGDA